MRHAGGCGFLVALVCMAGLFQGAGARAQDLRRPEERLAAIYSLRVQLQIEQRSLDQALQRYAEIGRERAAAISRLSRLYRELDDMVEGRAESSPDEIAAREDDAGRVEQQIGALGEDGRRTRALIREVHDRLEILQERISRLRRELPTDTESLTGTWNVSYLPTDDKGVFTLRQSGTLLVGEYILEGGWKGSLQGTFVDGKVLLHRIDSKLGRSSDLEGTLGADGQTIRGTWQSFILSGGQPTNGAWIASKQEEPAEP